MTTNEPRIALLHGGISAEREVSLGSGKAAAEAFAAFTEVDLIDVTEDALPPMLDPAGHVVFSTLHGSFGEDGQMQRLMEAAGVVYAGCDAACSELTFDKVATKAVLAGKGVPVLDELVFRDGAAPSVDEVVARFGESVVVKPNSQGSSIDLHLCSNRSHVEDALSEATNGEWLIEPRVYGREVTVGLIDGAALDIVEIRPHSGVFDFESKYSKGKTDYVVPAELSDELSQRVSQTAEKAYEACGCRDWCRIDFMITRGGEPYVLEINTLPGLKETSLLPMSAASKGISFDNLLKKLIEPAMRRFHSRYSTC